MYAPPLRYKREALAAHKKTHSKLILDSDSRWTQHQTTLFSTSGEHKQYNTQWT